jgi:ABC-type nickel/cobalt efflux system permease component RcnA
VSIGRTEPAVVSGNSDSLRRKAALIMGASGLLLLVISIDSSQWSVREELYHENMSSQISYADSKSFAVSALEFGEGLIGTIATKAASDRLLHEYDSQIKRYQADKATIAKEIHENEQKESLARNAARWLNLAEVLLEIAIVICSAAIFVRRSVLLYAAQLTGLTGAVVSAMWFLQILPVR